MKEFATREFTSDGEEVLLVINVPVRDGRDYRCDYSISFPDRRVDNRAFGVDSVQALYEALKGAHVDLLASPERRTGKLSWLEMTDFLLPLPDGIRPGDFPVEPERGG